MSLICVDHQLLKLLLKDRSNLHAANFACTFFSSFSSYFSSSSSSSRSCSSSSSCLCLHYSTHVRSVIASRYKQHSSDSLKGLEDVRSALCRSHKHILTNGKWSFSLHQSREWAKESPSRSSQSYLPSLPRLTRLWSSVPGSQSLSDVSSTWLANTHSPRQWQQQQVRVW